MRQLSAKASVKAAMSTVKCNGRVLLAGGQYDRLPALLADLIGRQVALIATPGGTATQAAKAVTATISIVFAIADDPVQLGLVASLAKPGGNVTGINIQNSAVVARRLHSYMTCFQRLFGLWRGQSGQR